MVAIQRFDSTRNTWMGVTSGRSSTGVTDFSVNEGESGGLVLSWTSRYGENETYKSESRQEALKKASEVIGFRETELRIR